MRTKNELHLFFFIFECSPVNMKPLDKKTIKLLSRSGLVLLFLSMGGSFVMAALNMASEGIEEKTLIEIFAIACSGSFRNSDLLPGACFVWLGKN